MMHTVLAMKMGKLLVLFHIRMKSKFFNNCVAFSILIVGMLFTSPLSFSEKPSEQSKAVNLTDMLKERRCAIEMLWYEARGESKKGMQAVLDVVKNRKKAKGFPETICKVVHQANQFSYRNHLKPGQQMPLKAHKALDKETLVQVSSVVDESLLEASSPVLDPSVLHYTHKDIRNQWTKKLERDKIIGNHQFYRSK